MPTTSPTSPGTLADDAGTGTIAWANPTNAASSNNSRAIAAGSIGSEFSHYLKATNFGFAIAGGATINGVTVAIERMQTDATYSCFDEFVRLVKGGTISGDNKAATATEWPAADGVATYGGASDLWGLSLTPGDVNDSTFGVVVAVELIGDAFGSTGGQVDHITITIDWTAAGVAGKQTKSTRIMRHKEPRPIIEW